MTTTTDSHGVSSTDTDQINDVEAREKRKALMLRAVDRLRQETDHVEQTERVVKPALIEFVKNHPLGEVIDTFIILEEAAERLDEANKAVQNMMSFIREVSFPERMDSEEMKTFTAESGDRVTRTVRLYASIATGMTDAAYQWMRENNFGSLIKETVNASSLSSAAKELIENGSELPEDLFRTHMKDGVSITKGKGKKRG